MPIVLLVLAVAVVVAVRWRMQKRKAVSDDWNTELALTMTNNVLYSGGYLANGRQRRGSAAYDVVSEAFHAVKTATIVSVNVVYDVPLSYPDSAGDIVLHRSASNAMYAVPLSAASEPAYSEPLPMHFVAEAPQQQQMVYYDIPAEPLAEYVSGFDLVFKVPRVAASAPVYAVPSENSADAVFYAAAGHAPVRSLSQLEFDNAC